MPLKTIPRFFNKFNLTTSIFIYMGHIIRKNLLKNRPIATKFLCHAIALGLRHIWTIRFNCQFFRPLRKDNGDIQIQLRISAHRDRPFQVNDRSFQSERDRLFQNQRDRFLTFP